MRAVSAPAEHDLAELCCRIRLHAGEDVLVDLHRERHAGVADAFADHFDRHACLKKERGVGVALVVQSDPRQIHLGDESFEGLGEVVGVERIAVGVGEDESRVVGSDAGLHVGLELPLSPRP